MPAAPSGQVSGVSPAGAAGLAVDMAETLVAGWPDCTAWAGSVGPNSESTDAGPTVVAASPIAGAGQRPIGAGLGEQPPPVLARRVPVEQPWAGVGLAECGGPGGDRDRRRVIGAVGGGRRATSTRPAVAAASPAAVHRFGS